MKFLTLISAVCMVVALAACGGDSSDAAETTKSPPVNNVKNPTTPPPTIDPPSGPPPNRVVIKELKEGTGPEIKSGDAFAAAFVGAAYDTGETFETYWGSKSRPFRSSYGTGEVVKGWEAGLKGMRVGGRRELIVPARLAYGNRAVVFIVQLLAAEK